MALKQTIGMKTDPDREYMTTAEHGVFKDLLKRGSVSFYRIGHCEECGTEIHKSKRYCSKDCSEGGNGNGESEAEFVD